jgi:hypothetical protein
MLRSRRNRPETEICSNGIGQTTGCDHVGNHHQPILPPVLQGRAVRHSKAASYLGLIVATRSVHPAPVEYDCEVSPSPGKKQSLRYAYPLESWVVEQPCDPMQAMITLRTVDGFSVCFSIPRQQQSELGEALVAQPAPGAVMRAH